MTDEQHPPTPFTLRVENPGDLIAAVPVLMGAATADGARVAVDRGIQLINLAVGNAEAAVLPDTDDHVVMLARALCLPAVRDHSLTLILGPQAAAAERLWAELVRATPAPHRATAAALLAAAAYLRGDGARANVALEIAGHADSSQLLAALLRQCVDSGINPDRVRALLTDATTAVGTRGDGLA